MLAISFPTLAAHAQESCVLPTVSLPEFQAAIDAKDAGNDSLAIVNMEALTEEFQGSPGPYYILGNWYWEQGRKNDALDMWKTARTAAPT
jgi:hypothetical protein